MQTPQPENIAAHFFWIAMPVMLATAAGQLAAYFANKRRGDEKDRERERKELEKETRAAVILENYKLHTHPEHVGALHAENIRYPES